MENRAEETLFFTSFEQDEWALPVSVPVNEFCKNMRAFSLATDNGPEDVWCSLPGVGWSGARALHINGIISGNASSRALYVLFDNLHITVCDDTKLSYLIFPALHQNGAYDEHDTAMHTAVDLKFDDGSYLHDYKLKDVNGSLFTPLGQGNGKTLYANQWNEVRVDLERCQGKTITQILVGFETNKNSGGLDLEFSAYIDDLHIYNHTDLPVRDVLDYVNILRGTNSSAEFSRGLTVPAVAVPFGFNFWCPANTGKSDEIYKYQPNGEYEKMRHITVSHQPSKWIGDRGTWQFMINTTINIDGVRKGSRIDAQSRAAYFSHKDETAKPDFYRVVFKKGAASGSAIELTPTCHAAAVRFMFSPGATHHNVIFDSVNAPGKVVIGADMRSFSAYTDHISGGMKRMYIYGTFSAPVEKHKIFGKQAILSFGDSKAIEMRVATSFISPSQARRNLALETSGKSFAELRDTAHKKWLNKLNKIEIYGASEEQLVTFYSNMYRLFLYPNLLSENTGTSSAPVLQYVSPYTGTAKKGDVYSGKMYYNNGFWDTYRTVWPAFALLAPNEEGELLNGLVEHYKSQGWIPRWVAPGGHNCMVGTSSDIIFGEAAVKNINFDKPNAYRAALKNGSVFADNLSNGGRQGIEKSIFKGYTSSKTKEGLSWSLEGCVNDFGIARMADAAGDGDNAAYYRNRSLMYAELFSGGWFRGKTYDETRRSQIMNAADKAVNFAAMANWETSSRGVKNKYTHTGHRNSVLRFYSAINKLCNILPGADKIVKKSVPSVSNDKFNPTVWGGDYTETNAWTAAFAVPHDGQGIINLYGGVNEFVKKLDEYFTSDRCDFNPGKYRTEIHEMKEAREIRLGQYSHANQPSHHIPYMYNYAGRPDKTAEIVRDILRRCYVGSSIGQGYCGDEDNGEMSAWYIFSALGMYPLSPASGAYAVGSPLFKKAVIHLENGENIIINAPENSDDNIYVRSLKINNKSVNRNFLRHSELMSGCVIDFEMGAAPSDWGMSPFDCAPSVTTTDEIPKPLHDLTSVTTATLNEPPTIHTTGYGAYCAGQKLAALFDDHSASYVTLPLKNGRVSLYYHFENTVNIKMYTLTSSMRPEFSPIRLTLSGFDGSEWVALDRRDSVCFNHERYTKPFLITNRKNGSYSCFRLDMDGADEFIELAELEFLG